MDPLWLADEARKLHDIFQNAFFSMVTAFLVGAVIMEFLKIPMGDSPAFATLVARAFIATFLMVALPEFMNGVADTTDSIARELGGMNSFGLVLERLGEKLEELSFSWTSLRDVVTILLSFLSFAILYVTIYFADAAFLYCWTLIYVFSPVVLALYVFPATSGATASMFRSIVEVSLWKICWAVIATLLWSLALSEINKPGSDVNWLTSIVLNIMLMVSVLMTPKLVRSLFNGMSDLTSGLQDSALQAASFTPTGAMKAAKSGLLHLPNKATNFAKSKGAAALQKSGSASQNFKPSKFYQASRKHSKSPPKPQSGTYNPVRYPKSMGGRNKYETHPTPRQ